jgi:hypothetical protein
MAHVRTDKSRALNLALQGGGAHGAFTWGVLDRLLEDERIEIEGISGTCRSRKSDPRVVMMQSGQNWRGDDGPVSLNSSS